MPYDLHLYDRTFFDEALFRGDEAWDEAPDLPEPVLEDIVERAEEAGFERLETDEDDAIEDPFFEGVDMELDEAGELRALLAITPGEITFTIPEGPEAEASIRLCQRLARQLALLHDLAYWDPQTDEMS